MKWNTFRCASSCLIAALAWDASGTALSASEPEKSMRRVYFGTYTGEESKGIYTAELNLETGELSAPVLAAEVVNPSFLAVHPSGKLLYAVGEVSGTDGKKGGGVTALSIDAETGKLTQINQQSSVGDGPCHIVVDPLGKYVLVANYGGGSVAALPIAKDGSLEEAAGFIQHAGSSVNPDRQQEPHAHSINLDPRGHFAYAADLGLDKVLIYKFDAAASRLVASDPPFATVEPGSGPRHFAFHPSGKFAYVINELANTVTVFSCELSTGGLKPIQTITTLPDDFKEASYTAEVQVHPSGKFLYGSNRGHDSIAVFAIGQTTGKLTGRGQTPTGGKTPRNFGIDPSGKFLLAANQGSGNVVVFRIDEESGALKPTGREINVPSPVCVKFLN